jgi:hypothetical protein
MIVPINYFNPYNGQPTTLAQRVHNLFATGAETITITELEKSYENNPASIAQMMQDITAYLNLIYNVGAPVAPSQPICQPIQQEVHQEPQQVAHEMPQQAVNCSAKSKKTALLLCIFLGTFGAHRFYVGRPGTGVASLATLGGFGIWALVDFILILCNKFQDDEEKSVCQW